MFTVRIEKSREILRPDEREGSGSRLFFMFMSAHPYTHLGI
jgi:hypothetical protein